MLWAEVRSGGKVSIRAAYHTVLAFESAADSTTLDLPQPFASAQSGRHVYLDVNDLYAIVDGNSRISLKYLTDKQVRILRVLARGEPVPSEVISEELNILPTSVSVYVSRLNNRVRELSRGTISPLVSTSKNGRGSGTRYILAAEANRESVK